MKCTQQLCFGRLDLSDIVHLAPMMKAAFDEDTRMFTNLMEDGPMGYSDGTLLKKLLILGNHTSEIVVLEGSIVGAYTISNNEDVYTLELLFVDPIYSHRGIGLAIWKHIESSYPKAKCWITETPDYSIRNQYFYINKCGFEKSGENVHMNGEKSILLKKTIHYN